MNSLSILALTLASTLVAFATHAQTCNPKIRPSAPFDRYVINVIKRTVLDKQTGLTWKRCSEGRSAADCSEDYEDTMSWGAALRRAETSTFAGHNDWRIPNIKELESLAEVACYNPAINTSVFPYPKDNGVWTSSPYANYEGQAWCVDFRFDLYYHECDRNNGRHSVWLVRGGQ